jgi:ATP synthase protein I
MNEKDRQLIRQIGVLSTVGLTMVFATVIGLYVGLKIDEWLDTGPWFTAAFLFLGIFAGFKNLFVYVKRSQNALDDEDKDNHDDR